MEEPEDKRYRQIKINLPELTAWKIERKIGKGTNGLRVLAQIFLHNFANGKAGLDFTFDLTDKDMQRILRGLDKQEGKAAA